MELLSIIHFFTLQNKEDIVEFILVWNRLISANSDQIYSFRVIFTDSTETDWIHLILYRSWPILIRFDQFFSELAILQTLITIDPYSFPLIQLFCMELAIAFLKGTHSCIQHSISKALSFSYLSLTYFSSISPKLLLWRYVGSWVKTYFG